MGEVENYETWMRRKGMARNTVHMRARFAERRLADWGTWDVSADQAAAWLENYHGWTRWTYHSHLDSLYAWMIETGRLTVSPVASLRRNRTPKPRPAPLSPDEVRKALDGAVGDERLTAFLLLGLYAGLRAHEIAKIQGRDVNSSSLYVLGKGGQGATLPTHPILWELAETMPTGHWFPSTHRDRTHISASLVGQVVAKHFRTLGLGGSIHRARATYGTELLRNGVNLRVIQDLLRHESLSSTQHYLGVNDDDRRAAIISLAA